MSATFELPPLRQVSIEHLRTAAVPITRIRTDDDVEFWRLTHGYQDYVLFLRRLNESVVGSTLPWAGPTSKESLSLITLLDTLDGWIDEIPPLPTPQRFGNLAFRTWGKRLEDEADGLLAALLPQELQPAIPFLTPYFLTSFGSFIRMDYGTGHETSFALFLLCLALLRFVEPEPNTERELVLCVFLRYLRLCWRLQDVYKLEPAGSHGVWGLDDYNFLGYIFGSGQLRDQTEIPVSAVLHPPLPPTNLYFLSIMRIHEVKHGPFHEHSSQLYAIASGVPFWHKVNSGLFKMYEAEVLGKRVVVQHIPLGGLLEWSAATVDAYQGPEAQSAAILPASSHAHIGSVTHAPWTSRNALEIGNTALGPSHMPTSLAGASAPVGARDARQNLGRRESPSHIVSGRLPLGPTASTALRPARFIPPSHSATNSSDAGNTNRETR